LLRIANNILGRAQITNSKQFVRRALVSITWADGVRIINYLQFPFLLLALYSAAVVSGNMYFGSTSLVPTSKVNSSVGKTRKPDLPEILVLNLEDFLKKFIKYFEMVLFERITFRILVA
jgi:hypothetical protein